MITWRCFAHDLADGRIQEHDPCVLPCGRPVRHPPGIHRNPTAVITVERHTESLPLLRTKEAATNTHLGCLGSMLH